MPSFEGDYSFKIHCNFGDKTYSGNFTVTPASENNHGPVRVANTYHFAHEDGTPYYPVGTTCYVWTHQKSELQEKTLETLKNSVFNKIRFCIFPKHFVYNFNEPAENVTRDAGMQMTTITTVDKYATSSMFQVTMWSIPVTCESPEKTMDFLNLTYASEEVVNLLSNGIEGKHYVKTDDPMIITYPEGVTVGTTGYNMPFGIFGDKMKKYAWAPTPADIFDRLREFNEEVSSKYASKALGYTFNSESVKNEVAAISNVISEYQPALETGTVDPEVALPEFIEKLKAAGIDKVIEENQRQLDEWLASKE